MFALLQNIFSYYRTYLFCFNIEGNTIFKALTSLRFDTTAISATEACAAPGGVYTTGAWAASGHVYSTEACAAPRGVYTAGAWAAPWRVNNTATCAAPGCVYTTWPGAASGLVYTTEACAAARRVYTSGAWAAAGRIKTTVDSQTRRVGELVECSATVLVYTTEACAVPDMSTQWGLSCSWTCLIHRDQNICSLCFI
jgi:hypothetical protein